MHARFSMLLRAAACFVPLFGISLAVGPPLWSQAGHDCWHTGKALVKGPSNNALAWKSPLPVDTEIISSPAIGADGTLYFGDGGQAGGSLVAMNGSTGEILWKFSTGSSISSSPALSIDSSTVYVGSQDFNVYAVNAGVGAVVWSLATLAAVFSSPSLGRDGTIYIGSDDGFVRAISPAGGLNWSFDATADVDSSPAIGTDGLVYFGAEENSVFALFGNGTLCWKFTTRGFVDTAPVIFAGTLYVGSSDTTLYV